jgi:hypothetical protein
VERLAHTKERQWIYRGAAFGDEAGRILRPKLAEMAIMDKLQHLKEMQPGLISQDIDMFKHFGISQSFRRGATSMARIRGVSDKYVDLINRWRTFENAQGRCPTLAVHDLNS